MITPAEHDRDGTRWCIKCFETVEWEAASERWVHTANRSPRGEGGHVATPAPEGMRGMVRRLP